jgi:kynurenine formamidase
VTTLYDLTVPICHTAQRFADLVPPTLTYVNTMVTYGSNTQSINMVLHFGTHLDAPFHYGYPMDLSQIPLDLVYGTGVIVDIPNKGDWGVITPDDLEKARPAIRENDIVILHTGWHKYWAKDEDRYAYKYPGLGREAVDWLVARKVKMVCSDTTSPEHMFQMADGVMKLRYDIFTQKIDREKFPLFYAHHAFLSRNILIVEQLGGQIAEVVGQRLTIAVFPLKLVHGDGCPVRVVAIKE